MVLRSLLLLTCLVPALLRGDSWTFRTPKTGGASVSADQVASFAKADALVGLIGSEERWKACWKGNLKEAADDSERAPEVDFKTRIVIFARYRSHGRCHHYDISPPELKEGAACSEISVKSVTGCPEEGHKQDHSTWVLRSVDREGLGKRLTVKLGDEQVELAVPTPPK